MIVGDGGEDGTSLLTKLKTYSMSMLGPGGGGGDNRNRSNGNSNNNNNNNRSSDPANIYRYGDASPDTNVRNQPKNDKWVGRRETRSITRGGLVDSSEAVRNTLGFEYINEEEPADASPVEPTAPRGFEAVDLLDKEKSAFQLGDPINDSNTTIGRFRNRLGAFINNRWVQKVSTALIIINAIVLGALTFLYDEPTATSVLETIDFVLLVLFTVEVAVQLIYLGIFEFGKNFWLLFDILVISLSWIFLESQFSIFRSFRIFRVFALVSRWSSLKRLFKAVGMTMPKMATIAFALLLFFYVFGVMYTSMYHNLWEDGYLDYNYFGRLDYTFLTLFQMMTLDSWTDVVRQVMEKDPFCWIGFMCWVIITAFFVFNLIIAVICESLIELQNVADESEKNELIFNQKRMMEKHRQELAEQSRQVLSLQSQTLANQVAIGATLVDIMEHLKDSHNYNSNYIPYSAPRPPPPPPPRAAPSSAPVSSWGSGTEFGSKNDHYHYDNMDTTTRPTTMMAGSGDDDIEEETLLFVEDEESPPVQKRQEPQSRQLPHTKQAPPPPAPLSPRLLQKGKESTSSPLRGRWSNKTESKQQEQNTKNGPSSLEVDEVDYKADNNNAVVREENSMRLLDCFGSSERSRISPSVGNIHAPLTPTRHQSNNSSVKQMLEASASEFAYWRSNLIDNNSWPGRGRGPSSPQKLPKSNSYNSNNSNITIIPGSPHNMTGSFSGRDNNDDTEMASFSMMRRTSNSYNNECGNNGSTMSILNEDEDYNVHEEEDSMHQQDDDSRDVAVVDDNDNNGNKRGRPSSSSLSTIQPVNTAEASNSSSPAATASLVAPSLQQQPSTDGLSEIAPPEGYTSRSPSSKLKLKSSESDDVHPSSSIKPTSSPSQAPSIENVDPSKYKSPSSRVPSSSVEPSNSVPSLHVQMTDTVSPSPSDASIGHTPPRSSISPPPSQTSTSTTTTTSPLLYKQTPPIQQEEEKEVTVSTSFTVMPSSASSFSSSKSSSSSSSAPPHSAESNKVQYLF